MWLSKYRHDLPDMQRVFIGVHGYMCAETGCRQGAPYIPSVPHHLTVQLKLRGHAKWHTGRHQALSTLTWQHDIGAYTIKFWGCVLQKFGTNSFLKQARDSKIPRSLVHDSKSSLITSGRSYCMQLDDTDTTESFCCHRYASL